MKIKHLEWEFPKNVEKKIGIGNITEIRQNESKFIAFVRILSISNVSKDDEGNYSCRVIDDYSDTKVSTHSLRIVELDSIFLNVSIAENSHTVTLNANYNSTVEFIAAVEAFPKHTTSTWYDPGNNKITDSDKYMMSDNEFEIKLKINAVEMKNFGGYQLKVDNSWIVKTFNFTLIVEDEPRIIVLKRTSRFCILNSNCSLECSVTGYPLPQIKWLSRSCNNYPDCEDDTFKYLPISFRKEEFLKDYEVKSTVNFKLNESMMIKCEANNSLGSKYNLTAALAFLPNYEHPYEVAIIPNYSESSVTVGDDIKFICTVSKYLYDMNFTWFSGENEITPSPEIQITNSVTNFLYNSTLSIPNVQKKHNGMYSCMSSVANSTWQRKFHRSDPVTLNATDVQPPSSDFKMNGTEKTFLLGGPGYLGVKLDGNPTPSVEWYKDGKRLSFNKRIISLNNTEGRQQVHIVNVSREDEGLYSFVATNKNGSVSGNWKVLIKTEENGFLNYALEFSIIFLLLIAGIIFWFIRKLHREKKKLQKILEEYGLKSDKNEEVPVLDPDIDIGDQTYLISYDKKYEFSKEKLKLGKVIGSGAFGIVRKAEALGIIEENVKTTVAVKLVKRLNDPLFLKTLATELKIMIYLGQHPNVLNLLGACTKKLVKGELAVIVEYCKYGNLQSFLLKQRNNFVNQIKENDEIDVSITTIVRYENIPFPGETGALSKSFLIEEAPIGLDGYLVSNNELHEPDWRLNYLADYSDVSMRPIKTLDLICWSLQTARGMEYLASRKVLHGDLAARNVLLAEGNIVKICDFGLSRNLYNDPNYESKRIKFPIKWMAIESMNERVFSTQSDVWSFGVTMWEFFSLGVSPYPGLQHTTDLFGKLMTGYRMEKPKYATNKIYNLMGDCWKNSPESRPSFTEICEKLTGLLEDSAKSQYVELSKTNPQKTNTDAYDDGNYLEILSPLTCNSNGDYSQPHAYANIPSKMNRNPAFLEMKQMPEDSKSL